MTRWSSIVGIAVLVVLAACSGDDDAAPSTTSQLVSATTVPAPTTTAPTTIDAYFGGLAGGAVAGASPGSEAAAYAAHRSAVSALLGRTAQPTVESLPEAIGLCTADCAQFTSIEADPATGELITFAIDGAPLAGRIAGPGEPSTIDGITLGIASTYRNDEALTVVVEVVNGAPVDVEVFGFAATWLPVGGVDALEATGSWGEAVGGQAVVAAGASGRLLVAFEPAAPFGEVTVTGVRGDGFDVEFRLASAAV